MRKLILLALLAWQLAAQPARIVSTAPSITEMLFALGLGSRVVGVTTFCHYPPAVERLPKIGTYLQPNLEMIASLRPDVVFLLNNPTRAGVQLRAMRLRVVELNHETVDGIFQSLERIGQETGQIAAAKKLNASLRSQLQAVRKRTSTLPNRKIMFIVGRNPGTLDGLVAVGRASYLNEMMEIAGGENIFRDALSPYPTVTLEEIIARNPDVIVDMGDMAQTVGVTNQHKQAVAALWKRYPTLNAVKNNRVFAVAADIYVVPGPRMVEAARAFARMLHTGAGF